MTLLGKLMDTPLAGLITLFECDIPCLGSIVSARKHHVTGRAWPLQALGIHNFINIHHVWLLILYNCCSGLE